MGPHTSEYDAVVIGGGLAGLTATLALAQAGRKVALLDRAGRPGGRAATVDKGGARFNLGAHALYRDGEAYAALSAFGLPLEGGAPAYGGAGLWGGKLIELPGDPLKLMRSRLLTWSGKLELGKLMLRLKRLDPDSVQPVSLQDWANAEIRDPMVRHLFYALTRTATYSADAELMQAGAALRQLRRSLTGGVVYLHGGWQKIVDGLRVLAERAGATFLPVGAVAIEQDERRVTGVRLADGTALTARRIVAAVPPAEIGKLVRDADRTAIGVWQRQARPVMAACLDVALKRLPSPRLHFAIGIDRPLYYSHHSQVARLSDNGTMVMHAMQYNRFGENDPRTDERTLEDWLERIHPGWRREIAARQYLPNMTVAHDLPHVGRTDPRPGPAVPEMEGLYVAGDWAGHGEWLADAAVASGKRAAEAVLSATKGR